MFRLTASLIVALLGLSMFSSCSSSSGAEGHPKLKHLPNRFDGPQKLRDIGVFEKSE